MAEIHPIPTHPRFKNLMNRRFGRLLVVEYGGKRGHNHYWKCRCDCGQATISESGNLNSGRMQACGCRQRKHGMWNTTEYKIWMGTKSRCHNPSDTGYPSYGARGITVCEKWRNDFAAFFKDVGNRPSKKHTLDRKNNDGNYEPTNVRWATRKEQGRNKRNNRIIEFGGERRTLSEWAEITEISSARIWQRLAFGWSVERTVTTPTRRQGVGAAH